MKQEVMVASVIYHPEHDTVEVLMVDANEPGKWKVKMFYRVRDPDNKCHCAVSGCCFPSGHIGNHRAADGHFIGNDFELGLQAEKFKQYMKEAQKLANGFECELEALKPAFEKIQRENAAMKEEIERLNRALRDSVSRPRPVGNPPPVADREMRAMVRREVGESAVAQVKGIEKPAPMMISCQGDWEP